MQFYVHEKQEFVTRLWSCRSCKTVIREFEKSEDKAAPRAVEIKLGWALSAPLPAERAAALRTTATIIADDNLANQLTKLWYVESYDSNCDVSGHSRDEQRAIKKLEQNNAIQR